MPDEAPAVPSSSWRVVVSWVEVVPNPNPQGDHPPQTVRRSYAKVFTVSNEAEGWDIYRSFTNSQDWLPPNAIEWQVDEPWRPFR